MAKAARAAFLVVLGTLLLPGCGQVPTSAGNDTLFFKTARGVAVLDAAAGAPSFRRSGAVPSSDWSTVVRSVVRRSGSRVTAVDPRSGLLRWERELAGELRVKVVSPDGSLVALGPSQEAFFRAGRSRTVLTIEGSRLAHPRVIVLDGNYEPEAFSTDGNSLFVIRYLPARNPNRYQVRRLDLATERVEAVYTPDSHLQQAMGGTARIQAASSDGKRLYTLYTLKNEDGSSHAFIHVLSLDELWAHCIDLPSEFATMPEKATAMTVAPDDGSVYVANSAEDVVAEIDTTSLQVKSTGAIDFASGRRGYAVHDGLSTLFLAGAQEVIALDTSAGFEEIGSWPVFSDIRGLQLSTDIRTLYVALGDRLLLIDAVGGEVVDTLDPPGVGQIKEFGPTMPSPVVTPPPSEEGSGKLTCAC